MTACAMVRECKEPSAPGEVPEEVFSDGGSTPPASTKKNRQISIEICRFFFGLSCSGKTNADFWKAAGEENN